MTTPRKCPTGEDCISKPVCKKKGPCWYYDVQKPTHDIIARLASEAGRATLRDRFDKTVDEEISQ